MLPMNTSRHNTAIESARSLTEEHFSRVVQLVTDAQVLHLQHKVSPLLERADSAVKQGDYVKAFRAIEEAFFCVCDVSHPDSIKIQKMAESLSLPSYFDCGEYRSDMLA